MQRQTLKTKHIERKARGPRWGWAVALFVTSLLAPPLSPLTWDAARHPLNDLFHLSPLVPAAAYAQSDPAHQQFLFAYKLLQQGDNQLAGDAFDDYLGKFPDAEKIGDAKYYRAMLYRRAGKNKLADTMLAHVTAPKLVPMYAVELLRGQVLSDLGRYKEAVAVLAKIDAGSLTPEAGISVLYLRGLAQRGAGNLPAAAKDLAAAAKLNTPMKGRALLDLARVQLLMKHEADAIKTLQEAISDSDSASPEAARMAGDVSYNQHDNDQAVKFYGVILGKYQGSTQFGPAVIGTMRAHLAAEQSQAAMDVFEHYRTALPVQERVPAWYLAGSAQQELGHDDQAVRLFTQISQGSTRYPLEDKVLYKLAASQLRLGRYDAMRKTIGRLTTRYPKSDVVVDAAFLLASADAAQGHVAQGTARLTQLINQGKDSAYYLPALLHRARLYEAHDQLKPAAQDYLNYLKQSHYTKVGRNADGNVMRQASPAQLDAFVHLLDMYQRLGSHGFAAGLARQWLTHVKLPPDVERETLYRRAVSLIQLNKPQDALAIFNRLAERYPASPLAGQVTYYRGLLLLSMKQGDQAQPLLKEAANDAKLPKAQRINALRLLALRQRNQKRDDLAEQSLQQLEALAARKGLTDDELIWMSQYALDHGDAKAGLAYAWPLVAGRPKATPEVRSQAVYLAGKANRALGQLDQAGQLFKQVVAMGHGFDLESRLELAQISEERGHYQQAMAELSGLISSESSSIAARAIFTAAAVQQRIADQARRAGHHAELIAAHQHARKLLKRLVLLYPFKQVEPLPQLAYLELANIEADLGQRGVTTGPDAAAKELQELIHKYPNGPYATYAKAALAASEHDLGRAAALLESIKKSSGNKLDKRLAQRVDALLEKVKPGP